MANEEHIALLKQGVGVWNKWREEHPDVVPQLFQANLRMASLIEADLSGARLVEANLSGADLHAAKLQSADLSHAHLTGAIMTRADLRNAKLQYSSLSFANLSWVDLRHADLTKAHLFETLFANTNLKWANGLGACLHLGPSVIDHRTLRRSGRLPLNFLRGCGLPDRLIDYPPSVLDETIHFCSCFISYSWKDQDFADRLHADLQNKGIRCWFAPLDLPIGAKIWDAIDEAIKLRDKLLLILSENSINSDWVEDEVSKAFAEERRRGQAVLFPLRIDSFVFDTGKPWAVKLRDQRNIGDFTRWKDHDVYQWALDRVSNDLRADGGETT